MILGAEPSKGAVIDFASARSRLGELGEAYGLELDLDDTVETLEVGERQRIEIIKILYRGARILILDEPTAVLVPQEVEELFRNMRELKAEGHTIIFIDHKLDEVLAIADSITILRQGRSVATVKPEDVTAQDLAELMVGSELPTPGAREATRTDRTAVECEDISVVDDVGVTRLRKVGFSVQCGEIVGVAGVEGNGQAELVEAILGIAPVTGGSIRLHDEEVTSWSVRRRREADSGTSPRIVTAGGLLLPAPIWENSILGHQTSEPFLRSGLWIDEGASKDMRRKWSSASTCGHPG